MQNSFIWLGRVDGLSLLAHQEMVRKGTDIPYISHPMHVASLVLENGESLDQACAALFHDLVEDCGVTVEDLERDFNQTVALIVIQCSDSTSKDPGKKAPWQE